LPPPGWILAILEDGKHYWVNPKFINMDEQPRPITELTPDQKERIKTVRRALAEHDPAPLEKWWFDFSCDTNPEKEIRGYEALASAYRKEVARRGAGQQERRLVYVALMTAWCVDDGSCSVSKLVERVLNSEPILKGLTKLSLVINAYRDARASRIVHDGQHRSQ
jgi:hypothetical protein